MAVLASVKLKPQEVNIPGLVTPCLWPFWIMQKVPEELISLMLELKEVVGGGGGGGGGIILLVLTEAGKERAETLPERS